MKRNKRDRLGKPRQPKAKTASGAAVPSVFETTFEGLPVRIVRKNVRGMSMRVDTDGVVRVTVPITASGLEIANFIRRYRGRMENQIRRRERSMDGRIIRRFSDGQTVHLWGRPLSLRIAARGPHGERKAGVYTEGDTAWMVPGTAAGAASGVPAVPTADEGRALLKEWYRTETKKALDTRIPAMEQLTGRHAEKWTVRDTNSQWGSCTAPRGQHARISICLWLAAYPVEALEYVMVHELCHIYEMSHSPKFWMYVERFMPDYAMRRRLLRR